MWKKWIGSGKGRNVRNVSERLSILSLTNCVIAKTTFVFLPAFLTFQTFSSKNRPQNSSGKRTRVNAYNAMQRSCDVPRSQWRRSCAKPKQNTGFGKR